MTYLKTSRFYPITAICLVVFLLSFVSQGLVKYVGIGLAFWLIMRAKPDGLLGLFLLYFSPASFGGGSDGLSGYDPVSVETMACAFIAMRVMLERILRPETFKEKFPKALFVLWLLAFIPVLAGFYQGYLVKASNWTRGLRWLMIAGSYFYGYILAKNWPKGAGGILFLPIMVLLAFVMLFLTSLGMYWSHHGFLFLGLGGAFSVYFLRNQSRGNKFIGGLLLFFAVKSVATSTLTAMGIVFMSVLLSYWGTKRRGTHAARKRGLKFFGDVTIAGILAFSFGIAFLGYNTELELLLLYGSRSAQADTFSQRIAIKTLSDRLPFWHSALEQIKENPKMVVPAGQPLLLETPGLPAEWDLGSHNVVLETLRINGIFAGLVMLGIFFVALKKNLRVLTESQDYALITIAAAILAVGVVGMTTGDFPADMTVGFWLWSFAGLCHGLFLQEGLFATVQPQAAAV